MLKLSILLLTGLGLAVGKPTGNTCPPANTTTITRTETSYKNVYSSTTTITYTTDPTKLVTVRTLSTSNVFAAAYTQTYTQPAVTTVIFVIKPAKTTVTMPIVSGFTPVLCETPFLNSYTTTTTTSIGTYLYYKQKYVKATGVNTTTQTTTIYTSTTTFTTLQNYTLGHYEYPTVTSTSTRSEDTRTAYAACATNNGIPASPYRISADLQVTPDYPGGGQIYYNSVYGIERSTLQEFVYAADGADCCAQCQANATCVSSAFYTKYKYPNCALYVPDGSTNQTCSPTFFGVQAYQGGLADEKAYVSNSKCGQVQFF